MIKTLLVVSALTFVARISAAQPQSTPDEPKIEYIGGLTLCANDPKALAKWYTEKFGLDLSNHAGDVYYGEVKFNGADLNVGIHPASDECRKSEKGFTITFHVDSYQKYIDKLKARGVTPFKLEDGGAYGKFAYFSDPENNIMAIWGK